MALNNLHSVNSYLQIHERSNDGNEGFHPSLKNQTVNDIVYGQVTLPDFAWTFVNERPMQRLKSIH